MAPSSPSSTVGYEYKTKERRKTGKKEEPAEAQARADLTPEALAARPAKARQAFCFWLVMRSSSASRRGG